MYTVRRLQASAQAPVRETLQNLCIRRHQAFALAPVRNLSRCMAMEEDVASLYGYTGAA